MNRHVKATLLTLLTLSFVLLMFFGIRTYPNVAEHIFMISISAVIVCGIYYALLDNPSD